MVTSKYQYQNKQMSLTAFLMPGGYDWRAWRLNDTKSADLGTFRPIVDIAKQLESAKIDALFIADIISGNPILKGDLTFGNPYEPLTALSALASVTENIGLIGTFSTTFNHPYTIARQLAALDNLSDGRAGWNIVTSSMAADEYGMELPTKEERYHRALEFVQLVISLWNAWDEDAVIDDKKGGNWVDESSIAPVSHAGTHFKVNQAILNQRRSPQGHPVLVQAGQSTGGRGLGSSVGEVIYTAQPQFDAAVSFYRDYKQAVIELGRPAESVKIMPGIVPYIADTHEEAVELKHSMDQFLDFDSLRTEMSQRYEMQLEDLDLDEQVPPERWAGKDDDTGGTRFVAYRDLALNEGYTLRDILTTQAAHGAHIEAVGTKEEVADMMVKWFEAGAADGFSLNPPVVPETVDQICEGLVPELQNRGYYKEDYVGTTLRDNLGLAKPSPQYKGHSERMDGAAS